MQARLILFYLCSLLARAVIAEPMAIIETESSRGLSAFAVPEIFNAQKVDDDSTLIESLVMVIDQSSGRICTGTVVSAFTIMTAAHCLPQKYSDLKVLIGGDPLSQSNSTELQTQGFVRPTENYQNSRRKNFDVALIYLSNSSSIYGLKSLQLDFSSFEPDAILAIGYGVGSDPSAENDERDGLLRMKRLAIEHHMRKSDFLFVRQDDGGVCHGDSGGPALVQIEGAYKVVAIANSVFASSSTEIESEKEMCSKQARYLKLHDLRDWILPRLK